MNATDAQARFENAMAKAEEAADKGRTNSVQSWMQIAYAWQEQARSLEP